MKYQLISKNYNNEEPELALHELLLDRGIKQPEEWLHPGVQFEHSPFLFNEMVKAINILHDMVKISEANILVVVDSDLDGYTSGAIIYTLLTNICYKQNISFVLHPGKEHGIVLDDIPENTDLIIVPDAGSSQIEEHMALLEKGMRLIILDHHEIERVSDYGKYKNNIAIINSQEENYPNHALSGAGVALKFVQAYSTQFGIVARKKDYTLAACGIVADVMDIGDLENKQIVTTGLKYMPEHEFLYQLVKDSYYNIETPTPTIKDVGWTIGPNINAIIRLGTIEQKRIVFLSLVAPMRMIESTKKGEDGIEVPIYQEAVRMCKNARKRQTTAVDKSINIIEDDIEIQDSDRAIVFVDNDQELTFELSGLIANKLLSKYNRPVILLRHYKEKDIQELRGSVRGKAVDGLNNLKELLGTLTGVTKAEGHAFACGIGIDATNYPEFKAHLNEALSKVDFNVSVYNVDLVAKYNELNIDIARVMARDDIWGHGVDKPLALITDIRSDDYQLMGAEGQHMKINCGSYDAIFFNVPKLTQQILEGKKFNIEAVGNFSIDHAYNEGRLQFMVSDYNTTTYTPKTIWDVVF